MANDSYDILSQLGDEKKVDDLKHKIEIDSTNKVADAIDSIEKQIETAAKTGTQEEVIKGILESNFRKLNSDVKESEKDLNELMLHLRAMLDSCGGEFAKLQELNNEELSIISDAENTQNHANTKLKDANEMSNAWNILFGYKNNKIKKAKQEVDNLSKSVEESKLKANRMYRDRLKNSTLEDSLNRIINQVQGMVRIIEGMIENSDNQVSMLKNRKEKAFETKIRAAELMEERLQELNNLEQSLKNEEQKLQEFESNTPEYTEKEKYIADLREQRAELKGKYNIALGIFQSKERFVDQIIVHLEAQTVTKNNLKQLIAQLKSDTEERITTYESGLHLIKSATAQEAASIYEEVGVQTDRNISEIAAKILVSSEKDRQDRIQKHPERMTELHKILVGLAEATAKFKKQDEKIMEEHKEKYGLDVSETFSFKYEEEKKENNNLKHNNDNTVNNIME